jgi:amino acid adenylation domain-containing protein/thioester reductase-like protein
VLVTESNPENIRKRPLKEAVNFITSPVTGTEPFGGERLVVEISTADDGAAGGVAAEADEDVVRSGAVRLICRVAGGMPPSVVSAELRCGEGDVWRRMAPAVSEIFAELLRELLADPGLSAAEAAGIGAGSRRAALGSLAGQAVDIGPFRAIPAMIEAQAERRPDRPAVSYDGRTLTYRQFDGAANALAAALAARGIVKGDVVPVVMVNGLEMPLAYYALMKIGAAFVPFDPAWPEQRIEAALAVLSPKLVLCAAAPDALVPEGLRKTAVRVDVDALAAAAVSVGRPGVEIGPDDVIYGIFTSGTTGTPKCAMNLHAGLTNRFLFMTRYFGADETEVVLQNSKHTFDSSVWQMFWPLTLGGHAVIPAQGEFLNLDGTIDTIAAHGVTMTDFVPTIFNMMVALAERNATARRKLSSLRRLIVGGEEITPQTVHKLSTSLLPGVRVTNGYGPTEASIGMVFHTVSPEDGAAVPLGRPIDNCYAVILSEDLHLLPPGAQGEIVIGGACLGSGYFNDPERTAQAFIRNPFPEIPGERLYRTGDLGYFDAAGKLWFIGRKDFQVKIGGVRVELGEIETAALGCPHVSQAKVLVAKQQARKSLAVFAAGDGVLAEEELRDHMRRILPRTSLPRHYFVLPEMPLTDHGKVDRRKLQAMLDCKLAEDAARLEYAGTVTMTAGRVLQIFRSVLEKPDLLPTEDFVLAGGDSLQALSVVLELESALDIRLGVQDLFENSTAEAMGRLVNRKRSGVGGEEESGDVDGLALMERDSVLPPSIAVAAALPGTGDPRTVLLTGATGFIGSRILHELLVRTDLRVICLCRAPDDAAATVRTVDALVRLGLWEERFAGRFEVLAGDLGRPALGLSDAAWDRVADGCDTILHNGALVNFLFDYRAHRAANVVGTQELLRLAFDRRPKSFHHVSTLGVLDCEAALHEDPLPETFDPAVAVRPNSGYSRSKWVAERCIADARAKGAPVTVFRLGEVMPGADNGQPNRHALTHFLLSGFGKLGICPDVPMWSDYTPVDYVAARLVAGLFDRDASGRTLHVFHPERVSFTEILPRVGLPLERVSCAAFLQHLDEAVHETADRELTTLRALLPQHAGQDEAVLRRVFGGLLVDNPRLFRKDECRGLERRWELEDGVLDASMAAYRRRIAAVAAPAAEARSAVNF